MSKSKTRHVRVHSYTNSTSYVPYLFSMKTMSSSEWMGITETLQGSDDICTLQTANIFWDDSTSPEIEFCLEASVMPVAYHGKQFNNVAHTTVQGDIVNGKFVLKSPSDHLSPLSTSAADFHRFDQTYGNIYTHIEITRRSWYGLCLVKTYTHEWAHDYQYSRQYEWHHIQYHAYQRPISYQNGYCYTYRCNGCGRSLSSPFTVLLCSAQSEEDREDAEGMAIKSLMDLEASSPITWDKSRQVRSDLNGWIADYQPSSLSIEQLTRLVSQNVVDPEGKWRHFTLQGRMWSALSFDYLQDIGMSNSNGLAYAKDTAAMAVSVFNFRNSLQTLVNKLMKLGKGKKIIQHGVAQFSSAYLSEHYGYRLQYQDTKEYLEQLRSVGSSVSRHTRASSSFTGSTSDGWNFTQRAHLIYDNLLEEDQYLSDFLKQIDLMPTFENGWDMVPYSFVIDWFTDFGDVLNAIDNMYYVQSAYKVVCEMQSITATRPLDLKALTQGQCTGHIFQTYYARRVLPTITTPVPDGYSSPSSKFNHYLEAGALITQRIP